MDAAGKLADSFYKAIKETNVPQGYTKLGVSIYPAGNHGLSSSAFGDCQLQDAEHQCMNLDLTLPGCDDTFLPAQTVMVWFLPPGSATDNISGWVSVVKIESVAFENGKATASFDEDNVYDSAGAKTEFCDDCVVIAAGSNCDCADGTMTTSNVKVRSCATTEVGAALDRILVTDVDRDAVELTNAVDTPCMCCKSIFR